MRYFIAAITALLLVIAGIAIAGGGHGWVSGAVGCFALAPVSFIAVANGLSRTPSSRLAVSMLMLGLALCAGVAAATAAESTNYLSAYLRATGTFGVLVAIFAYASSLIVATLATMRARKVSRHGT